MNQSPKPLGKGMIIAAWILLLALLTLFFNDYLQKQHNPNQKLVNQSSSHDVREVTLQQNRSGHYVATGTVNGLPVVFLLDTGATIVSIPQTVAERLNLEPGAPLLASTANGVVKTYSTRLDNVSLGPIQVEDVRASINPSMGGEDILLGMSFLRHLEFTQRGNSLIIRQYTQ